MNSANEITKELQEMDSALAGMSRAMPYAIPVGYFDDRFTVSSVQSALGSEPAITFGNTMPHSVPAGYFEELAGNVMAAVGVEPAFNFGKAMPHRVPAGYFDAMPGKMLLAAKQATQIKKTATIIALDKAFRQVRWAAAAVLLVCIGLGSYISFFSGGPQGGTEVMLASVPNDEIHEYLQQHSGIIDIDRIVNNNDINKIQVDNSDIVQYLNETGWDVLD